MNDKLYLKNPDSSELGQRIVAGGIELIELLGFEHFTFKKLGMQIHSPEASIYRYFESKHQLLLYLISTYWHMKEYQLTLKTTNISSPEEKLSRSILALTNDRTQEQDSHYIDQIRLFNIVIAESSKTYLTKEVDVENRNGLFKPYKRIVQMISEMILEINRKYPYPNMLVSTMIEGIHHQRFFAMHLPSLTNSKPDGDAVSDFFIQLVFRTIEE